MKSLKQVEHEHRARLAQMEAEREALSPQDKKRLARAVDLLNDKTDKMRAAERAFSRIEPRRNEYQADFRVRYQKLRERQEKTEAELTRAQKALWELEDNLGLKWRSGGGGPTRRGVR